ALLLSESGLDAREQLRDLGIGYVVLNETAPGRNPRRPRRHGLTSGKDLTQPWKPGLNDRRGHQNGWPPRSMCSAQSQSTASREGLAFALDAESYIAFFTYQL
ncbi:hypothetical protein, partial [Glutamicibacter protophormiae]|uniref:hypothetical protein n=1 Tax=Glutamicibacter protophormiae TaxID=37930 RepID=UPI0033316DCA